MHPDQARGFPKEVTPPAHGPGNTRQIASRSQEGSSGAVRFPPASVKKRWRRAQKAARCIVTLALRFSACPPPCPQATEPLVRFAMEHNVPFAVVPCCVFRNSFTERRLRGKPVRTRREWRRWRPRQAASAPAWNRVFFLCGAQSVAQSAQWAGALVGAGRTSLSTLRSWRVPGWRGCPSSGRTKRVRPYERRSATLLRRRSGAVSGCSWRVSLLLTSPVAVSSLQVVYRLPSDCGHAWEPPPPEPSPSGGGRPLPGPAGGVPAAAQPTVEEEEEEEGVDTAAGGAPG